MKPEVICTAISTTGQDVNIIAVCLLGLIACAAALVYLHPDIGHWVALHVAANAEAMKARRAAGMRARQEFLADNRQAQE